MSLSKKVITFLAIVVASVLFSSQAMAETYTIKFSHVFGPGADQKGPNYLKQIKAYLDLKAPGKFKMEEYGASQLGNYREMVEQVRDNTLEMAITTTGGIAAFVPEIQVTDLSYAIPGMTRVSTLLCESSLADAIRDEVLKKVPNVRLMGMSETAVRSFMTTGKEIRTAADLKGIKMRTINSPLQMELVKILGGNATPVAWSEVYTSLETGVIEGIKNDVPTSLMAKLVPPLKYIILDMHSVAYKYCWVSDKWLKSLPTDLQIIVAEAVREAAMFTTHFVRNQLTYANEKFVENGGTVYYPTKEEKETFLKAKPLMRKWFINRYEDGEKWVKIQEKAIAEVEAKIAAENRMWTE